jgi:phosphopantetheine adenylyltransferase
MPKRNAKTTKTTKTAKPIEKATTKKAFDLPRDSVFAADPIKDLRICGGAGVLSQTQSGDLDTPPGPNIPVRDQRRIARPLKPGLVENIDRFGVKQPIVIAKIDDIPTVIVGKGRVRAAREANRRRIADGQPLLKIRCVMQRDTSRVAIMNTILSENNAREDDDLADQIEKVKELIEAGGSEADAAIACCVKQSTIRTWLDYDDRAVDELKAAVKEKGIKASTAIEIAKIRDPDEQRATLDRIIASPGSRQQSARAARALRHEANGTPVAMDRRSQRLLLSHVIGILNSEEIHEKYETEGWCPSCSRAASDDLGNHEEFWRGARSALALVTGSGGADPKMIDALAIAVAKAKKKQELDDEESNAS